LISVLVSVSRGFEVGNKEEYGANLFSLVYDGLRHPSLFCQDLK